MACCPGSSPGRRWRGGARESPSPLWGGIKGGGGARLRAMRNLASAVDSLRRRRAAPPPNPPHEGEGFREHLPTFDLTCT